MARTYYVPGGCCCFRDGGSNSKPTPFSAPCLGSLTVPAILYGQAFSRSGGPAWSQSCWPNNRCSDYFEQKFEMTVLIENDDLIMWATHDNLLELGPGNVYYPDYDSCQLILALTLRKLTGEYEDKTGCFFLEGLILADGVYDAINSESAFRIGPEASTFSLTPNVYLEFLTVSDTCAGRYVITDS